MRGWYDQHLAYPYACFLPETVELTLCHLVRKGKGGEGLGLSWKEGGQLRQGRVLKIRVGGQPCEMYVCVHCE